MGNILTTRDLTKVYGTKTVLNKVNMNIQKGDIYGFIGKNGAGKTTLMRTVLGLAFKTDGEYSLFDGVNENEAKKRIGALIEYPVFFDKFSAYENMHRFSLLFGQGKSEIDDILKFVGLENVGKKPVSQFSLGMKQRLGIAIAMLSKPEFMILDEPVNGLDPSGITEVRDLILKLNREKGVTFLISSHLLDELSRIATKFGIIDKGNLVEEISSKDLSDKFIKKIIIDTNDGQAAERVLTSNTEIAQKDIQIINNRLIISSQVENIGYINRLLVENDIMVTALFTHSQTLEQYYMQKVGY